MKERINMSIVQMPDTYYPTQKALTDEMASKLDREKVRYVLEPSAWMGALCKAISRRGRGDRWSRDNRFEIDCIEIDPQLRSNLRYVFSYGYDSTLIEKERKLEESRRYGEERPESEKAELARIREERDSVNATVHIVHDDFLTFRSQRRYDAIVMNQPFDHGDLHLLHALDLMKDGGQIVCLLNAETIRNPYTNSRKLLKQQLEKYGAEIEYKTAAFMTDETERKTDVEVALVRVTIPEAEHHSILYDILQKAKEQEQAKVDLHELTTAKGTIDNMIEQYETEIRLGVAFINEYFAICPYIRNSLNEDDAYGRSSILTLTVGTGSNILQTIDVNDFAKKVRKKYWNAFFHNEEFTGMLTSNLRKDFQNTVDEMANYEFSSFNIQQVLMQMQAQLTRGVEETIMALFEKLTVTHTWYPECNGNIHYYNGWHTNKAHKVGKKCIIPANGSFAERWSSQRNKYILDGLKEYSVYNTLADIEKALNYLDCGETTEQSLGYAIQCAISSGLTKIRCKYFDVVFYKKGTCHITFTCPTVIDKLNIFAGRRKGWLPPRYGKVRYNDMTNEEKAVIDDFSGKEAYDQVCNEPGRFIIEVDKIPLLGAGTGDMT